MKNIDSLGIKYTDGKVQLIDQQQIPHKEIWLDIENPEAMSVAIKKLQVRGAPLIGVAAALSLADFAEKGASKEEFQIAADMLRESRPTAVNLMWAIDRFKDLTKNSYDVDQVVGLAEDIFTEDMELCENIGNNGADLIDDGDNVLTHCNTGGLATAGIGTALGVIQKAHEQGKKIHVYVDETRPLLQGGRLTTWELEKRGIPYTLICDNMAGMLMSQGRIQKAIVGADRIATNGDFANKIGTYSVALMCYYHRIPFFTAAPYTTVDPDCPSGQEIPIELRKAEEVRGVAGAFGEIQWAPLESKTYNPAFDVTPSEFVSAWILDKGKLTLEEVRNGALIKSFQ